MTRNERQTAFATAFILLITYLCAPVAVHAQSDGVILWNRLGSDAEVMNSEIGAGFGIHADSLGGVLYVPGKFGNALATTGGENGGGGYLTISPDLFYPADRTRGTIEMWIQKRIQRFIPFQTPLVAIFGDQLYDGPFGPNSIMVYWSDGYSGLGGLEFDITDGSNNHHKANDLGWDDVPVGQWVHVAFVWDLAGIDGSVDTMRIYRDGVVVGSHTNPIPNVLDDSLIQVKLLTNHAYSRFGQPTAYLDNIIVWDQAKTNFCHRFNENPASPPELSALISGKSGPQNARVWTLTLANKYCPAENAQIDGLTLTQTYGAACTPVITSPAAFPLSLGNIPASGTASGAVTLDFSGCANSARFSVTIAFSANNGAVTGSKTLNNQFR